jgi:hypothetical protein
VHLDLRKSPQIFEILEKPQCYNQGPVGDDSLKNLKQKSRGTVSLNENRKLQRLD